MKSDARTFDSQEQRDQYLEGMYDYDREGFESTAAFVAARVESLAGEFFWWADTHRQHEEPMPGALLRFEEARFGSALDEAPHGVLWLHVRRALRMGLTRPADVSKATVPSRLANEPTLAYLERVARANGWLAGKSEPLAKPMPRARRAA